MEKEIPNDTQIVTPGNMYLLSTVSVTLATDRAISSPPALPLAEDACFTPTAKLCLGLGFSRTKCCLSITGNFTQTNVCTPVPLNLIVH